MKKKLKTFTFLFAGTSSLKIVSEFYWSPIPKPRLLEQLWISKLVVFTIPYIFKVWLICVNTSFSPDQKYFPMKVIQRFWDNVEDLRTPSRFPNTLISISKCLVNIFLTPWSDSCLSSSVRSSESLASKTNWRSFKVNTKKISLMTFGGRTKLKEPRLIRFTFLATFRRALDRLWLWKKEQKEVYVMSYFNFSGKSLLVL